MNIIKFTFFLDKAILKINVRLGGVNWELEAIKNNMFTSIKQPYMVFGIDLMPPLPSTKNVSLSTTAMVGSMNHSLTVYNTTIHKQISKENETIVQVILHMENMVHQLLKVSMYNILAINLVLFTTNCVHHLILANFTFKHIIYST